MNSTQPDGVTMPASDPLADVVAFLDLPKLYPQFFASRHSAGWLLRQRDRNGLAAIVRWIGRTAYVSRAEFATWFLARSSRHASSEARVAAPRINLVAARRVKAQRATKA